MSGRGARQDQFWSAAVTVVTAPLSSLAVGILFLMVGQMYTIVAPSAAAGPFQHAYATIGTSLAVGYDLLQLASAVEFWIAIAVLVVAVYSALCSLGNTSRRDRRRRR